MRPPADSSHWRRSDRASKPPWKMTRQARKEVTSAMNVMSEAFDTGQHGSMMPLIEGDATVLDGDRPLLEVVASTPATQEDDADRVWQWNRVKPLIARLPREERAMLLMTTLYDMDAASAGRSLGISRELARRKKRLAIQRIRLWLNGQSDQSGHEGVYLSPDGGWEVQISIRGKKRTFGPFDDLGRAIRIRRRLVRSRDARRHEEDAGESRRVVEAVAEQLRLGYQRYPAASRCGTTWTRLNGICERYPEMREVLDEAATTGALDKARRMADDIVPLLRSGVPLYDAAERVGTTPCSVLQLCRLFAEVGSRITRARHECRMLPRKKGVWCASGLQDSNPAAESERDAESQARGISRREAGWLLCLEGPADGAARGDGARAGAEVDADPGRRHLPLDDGKPAI